MMISINPVSITLKPLPVVHTASGFPHKRLFNRAGYFELSGTALLDDAEKAAIDRQQGWDDLPILGLLGLDDYVARHKAMPKHTLTGCGQYSTQFSFEIKPVGGELKAKTAFPEYFEVTPAGDLLYYVEDDSNLTFSLSGYDLVSQSIGTDDVAFLSGDTVYRVPLDDAPVKAFFFLDNDFNLLHVPDPAMGVFSLDAGGALVFTAADTANGSVSLEGDAVMWREGGTAVPSSYADLPAPLLQGFAESRVEFRTAQQFSSGRVRMLNKRPGYLRDVSFNQEVTPTVAAGFVQFYRRYDHEPLVLPWVTEHFGVGRRLVFAAEPWELKADAGKAFWGLSVKGYVI